MSDLIRQINDQEFESTVEMGKGYYLVDFWAPWCGPCRMLAPILEQIAEEYKGKLTILKVNVDDFGDVASKFGISGIPTMILFHDGKVTDQHVGMAQKSVLKDFINKHVK